MELLPMRVTRPVNDCPGKASMRTLALSPMVMPGTSVSSTSTLASITDRSAMVSSSEPGLFMVPTTAVSPTSMFSRVTRPVIGATMVVLESWSRASLSSAADWPVAKRAACSSCSATCAEVRACSTSAAETSSLVCASCSVRRSVASALVSCARACRSRAWLCDTAASARRAEAMYCAGSMRMSRAPCSTHCPSSTATCTTRPGMSAEMSTLRLGSILPLACTTATSDRRPTTSVFTLTPRPPELPPPRAESAPSTTMVAITPAPMAAFIFVDMDFLAALRCGVICGSAERAAHQGLQHHHVTVEHVDVVDQPALGLGQAGGGVDHLQRVGGAQAKALAGHAQLLAGVLHQLALQADGLIGPLQLQVRGAHAGLQALLQAPHGQLGVGLRNPRFLHATLALPPVEQGE